MNLPIDISSGGPGIIVDLFAGGGGASEGIRMALGRDPDLAIDHDPEAVAMHRENHPGCRHLIEDIWTVDPSWATQGQPVALLWASPDCTHHSKAKGSAPTRDDKRRSLACVITDKWIPSTWPETIIMENVEEITSWGPLDREGRIIESAKGDTWRWFLRRMRRYGYRVEYRELRACDYGAPTIRRRLFLVAKRNNAKIVWPEPTHGPGRPEPYRTAADCIDWSIPCPSIFERSKPLADATLRRIAKGIMRYVVQAERPFIVNLTHGGRLEDIASPINTITCANRGEKALVVPTLVQTGYGERPGRWRCKDCGAEFDRADLPTCGCSRCGSENDPVEIKGQAPRALDLFKLRGSCRDGQALDVPAPTITAGGTHAALVHAFLVKYYGADQDPRLESPLHTITTRDRFGVVTVTVEGEPYYIADIGLRMLQPRELFRAQGFPDSYVIDHAGGRPLTKTAQVRMCGNSVCPPIAAALVKACVNAAVLGRAVA
jgi:DNA (cytosine-5)-methyltransferase 1